jgi:hypothetical protein
MGTRAAFWKGDPRNLADREWLGCIAFDGYPDGKVGDVLAATSLEAFLAAVQELSQEPDFADPRGGWPFPWSDDVFLTDFTYAWFNDEVNVSCFHSGFVSSSKAIAGEWPENDDPSCSKVPSGKEYDRSQPDSIMIFTTT